MTRKQLEDLGLSKEQADAIIKINGDDIENAKSVSSAELKNMQTEVDDLKGQVKDRDKQLETLKASTGDNEALTKQIADLQKANTDAAAAHESEMNKLKIDFAVEKALKSAGAKNLKAVRALLELEDAKFDKEGNVKGLAEQIEKLTSGDDTKFLFNEVQQQNQNTFKGFQPGASGEVKPGAEVDPSKMTYEQLAAYMEANPDAQI
nr:MAG TPA: minor structural protein [Caudoviricetes sp.]